MSRVSQTFKDTPYLDTLPSEAQAFMRQFLLGKLDKVSDIDNEYRRDMMIKCGRAYIPDAVLEDGCRAIPVQPPLLYESNTKKRKSRYSPADYVPKYTDPTDALCEFLDSQK